MTAFKDAGLEYIALQAENFLENNLLESLDEEVIEELDSVVRDNQLAHYPFARSGRAELLLHEQNPDLTQDIEEERQRRVREMAFRANQKEEEKKLSSSLKGRFGSLEDSAHHSPSLDKQAGKRRSSRNEPFSPDLRPKSTQADLMFDMDDDEGLIDSPSVRPQRTSDAKKQLELDSLPLLSGPNHDEKQKVVARPPMVSSPAGTTPIHSNLAARPAVTTPGKTGNPWAPAALPTTKLDLRKLMGESSGPSALSAGLAAQKAKDAAKPQQTKVSQKERKKQQQLQAEQAAKIASTRPTVAWDKASVDAPSSPWKMVSSGPKPSLNAAKVELPASAPSNPKPLLAAEVSAKSISRRTQSPDTRHSGQSRTPTTATPVRPPSKPNASVTTSTFAADDPSKPIIPHSKSYIKPACKSESILGLSMADIIDLERRKQEAVKEAAAKRSLMEIQQEQEFSIWWEEESRRTQQEEARRLASQKEREDGKARGRRGRSAKTVRGGRGGSGGDGGPSNSTMTNSAAVQSETTRQQGQENGRGRGNRRGRGQGGPARNAA